MFQLDKRLRDVPDLNLRAFGQHFLGVKILLFTTHISLGALPQPKTRALRNFLSNLPPCSTSRCLLKILVATLRVAVFYSNKRNVERCCQVFQTRTALHLKNALQFGFIKCKKVCTTRPDVQRILRDAMHIYHLFDLSHALAAVSGGGSYIKRGVP